MKCSRPNCPNKILDNKGHWLQHKSGGIPIAAYWRVCDSCWIDAQCSENYDEMKA